MEVSNLKIVVNSDALSVHNRGTVLVVVLLGDPHAREGRQRGQGGTTFTGSESSVGAGDELGGDRLGSAAFDLLEESLANALEHGVSTGQDDVGVEVSSDINVALLD